MDITVVIDEIRRKAAALTQAADTLEETFLTSPATLTLGQQAVQRWAPGTGASPLPEADGTAEEPAKPVAPRRRSKPAPIPTSGTPDQNLFRQVVHCCKEIIGMNVHEGVLAATLKNYLEGKGLPADSEMIVEAMAVAQDEIRTGA